jgi:MFS family permease
MRATNPYYVLALLLAGYVMNSLDRGIIAVLLDPIGREFSLSDTQLGLLAGLAFAAFFSTLGIPVAALADRTSRRRVLAVSIFMWSVATMCCGLAGSFMWLLLARVGTAVGESGSTPASHSLITDYFPPHRLATAMAVFSLGAPLGTAFAGLWGGYGNDLWGWRTTIMLAGLPGLLLAPLVWFTIREKPKVHAAAPAAAAGRPFIASATHLLQRKSFRHLFLACALHSMAIHSSTTFNATFLIRSFGWDTSHAGQTMALLGILSGVGVILGGVTADRLSQRTGDQRWLMWVPALATLIAVPFHTIAYLVTDATTVLVVLPVASMLGMMFFGPAFALGQSLAAPGSRAVVSSILLFGMTLIGLGLGPLLVGTVSDWLAPTVHQQSLQYALLLSPAVNIWAVVHFALAARTLRQDIASPADKRNW